MNHSDRPSAEKAGSFQKKRKGAAFLEGNACILSASIFWGVNIALTKSLIPEWMSAYGVTCVRLIGGCALFWLASIFLKDRPIAKEDWLTLAFGGAVGLFTFIFLNIAAIRFGSAIDVSIIMTLPPMIVILIDAFFKHDKPGVMECAGVIVSFAGAAAVALSGSGAAAGGSDYLLGDFLAFLSAACYACYLVIMEKPSRRYKPANLLRWVFLFAAVPSLLLIPGMRDERIFHQFSLEAIGEISYILIFPTFLAYFLVQPAIKLIGAELVSLYQYTTPMFAALACALMGLEKLEPSQAIAMAVIILGMILVNAGKKRRLLREEAGEGAGRSAKTP